MFENKHIVVGVCGGIAAYKAAGLVSRLRQSGADVHCIMTKNAAKLVTPITFGELSGNDVTVDMFANINKWDVEHIALARLADVFVIAPATADIIGKVACGIADDMLSTTIMATKAKVIFVPSMNTNMYENPIVQDNLNILKKYDMEVVEPAVGYLACGDTGAGKMPEPELLLEYILKEVAREKDMRGLKVLVTAGPTREAVDPVRYITNHSTGRMGYAIARVCMQRGAEVTLVTGPSALKKPEFVKVVPVTTAKEMFDEVTGRAAEQDIIIKAAAVADYRPKYISDEKVKKKGDNLSLELERTDDILAYLGMHKKEEQFLCGFSMETEHMLENSRGKLQKKNLDMIVANSLKVEGAGFGGDTNIVTIITKDRDEQLGKMSKEDTAAEILDRILSFREGQEKNDISD